MVRKPPPQKGFVPVDEPQRPATANAIRQPAKDFERAEHVADPADPKPSIFRARVVTLDLLARLARVV